MKTMGQEEDMKGSPERLSFDFSDATFWKAV